METDKTAVKPPRDLTLEARDEMFKSIREWYNEQSLDRQPSSQEKEKCIEKAKSRHIAYNLGR